MGYVILFVVLGLIAFGLYSWYMNSIRGTSPQELKEAEFIEAKKRRVENNKFLKEVGSVLGKAGLKQLEEKEKDGDIK